MPKYLLLKHDRGGPEPHRRVPPMGQWAPEDLEAHGFIWQVEEEGPARSGGPPSSKVQA
jgi:hypothetical protein